VNEPVAGPFTLAHVISGLVAIAGVVLLAKKAELASQQSA
jgi:hypothetical protein